MTATPPQMRTIPPFWANDGVVSHPRWSERYPTTVAGMLNWLLPDKIAIVRGAGQRSEPLATLLCFDAGRQWLSLLQAGSPHKASSDAHCPKGSFAHSRLPSPVALDAQGQVAFP